jgi:hypothetical protein
MHVIYIKTAGSDFVLYHVMIMINKGWMDGVKSKMRIKGVGKEMSDSKWKEKTC